VSKAPAPPQPRLVREIRERLEALRDRINADGKRCALVTVEELRGRFTVAITIYPPAQKGPDRRRGCDGAGEGPDAKEAGR
jgi:hypothetical protein